MHKKPKKILIIISSAVILLILGMIFAYCYIPKLPNDISGRLIDSATGEAISENVYLLCESARAIPDKNGYFSFKRIHGNATIEVYDQSLYSPLKVEIRNRSYIEISINRGSEIYLDEFFRNLKLAQYRKNYEVLDPEIKTSISEAKFLTTLNSWSENNSKQGMKLQSIDYGGGDSKAEFINPENNKSYPDALPITVRFAFVKDGKQETTSKVFHFVQNDGKWFWIFHSDLFK